MVYIVVYTSYYLPVQAQPLGLRHFFREAVGWIFSPMPPHRKYCSAKFNLARGVAAKNKGFLLSLFVEKLSSSEKGLNMPNTCPLPASFLTKFDQRRHPCRISCKPASVRTFLHDLLGSPPKDDSSTVGCGARADCVHTQAQQPSHCFRRDGNKGSLDPFTPPYRTRHSKPFK